MASFVELSCTYKHNTVLNKGEGVNQTFNTVCRNKGNF